MKLIPAKTRTHERNRMELVRAFRTAARAVFMGAGFRRDDYKIYSFARAIASPNSSARADRRRPETGGCASAKWSVAEDKLQACWRRMCVARATPQW